jgi:hypothetical protein
LRRTVADVACGDAHYDVMQCAVFLRLFRQLARNPLDFPNAREYAAGSRQGGP